MKRKRLLKIVLLSIMALILIFSCVSVSAVGNDVPAQKFNRISPLDFGNENDYGGGGDWGGNDWGNNDWGSGYDYDYDGGELTFFGFGSIPVIVIVVVIFIIIAFAQKSKGKGTDSTVRQGTQQGRNILVPDRTAQIESIIKEYDPNFSASDFLTFGKEVFVDIQEAWSARDLSKIRVIMHDNLFNQTQKQVESKIKNGVINKIENIAVSTAYLTAYKYDKQFEYVTMYLNARFIDYEIDEKTGNVLRGDTTTRWEMRYLLKFVRSTGVKTNDATDVLKSHNCPNCGAPLQMESSGVCEYCGSVVTTGQYSWVLSAYTSVRNDTIDEGISVDRPPKNNNNNM
ncbi:MAG: TIM44-like domain-containing protein [Ruminococcus sp.]|nr:TIM44-like domain-containing protein [Ruminococcus sp.]